LHRQHVVSTVFHVRTTIDLDEATLYAARELALARRTTLSAIVREALVASLQASKPGGEPEPFELVRFGTAGGRAPSPAEMAEQQEAEDGEAARS
jgi:hypothetical protein